MIVSNRVLQLEFIEGGFLESMNYDEADIPLSVKIIKHMYHLSIKTWRGTFHELAGIIHTHDDESGELKIQMYHAIELLKKEGILSAKSGFHKKNREEILLELTS